MGKLWNKVKNAIVQDDEVIGHCNECGGPRYKFDGEYHYAGCSRL